MIKIVIFPPIFQGTATVSEKEGRGKLTEDDEDDGDDTNEVCEDRINNIAGSLSCKNFLRSFAYQYCRHKYIKKNCCASHKVYCLRGRRGRRARQKLLQQVPSSEVATRSRRYWSDYSRGVSRNLYYSRGHATSSIPGVTQPLLFQESRNLYYSRGHATFAELTNATYTFLKKKKKHQHSVKSSQDY